MSSAKPRGKPRDRSEPAAPSVATLARFDRQARAAATRARNDPWTRVQDAKLLKAWREGKTDQALADAVGGGRTAEACQKRLHGTGGLVPKRLYIAYEWNPADPQKHSAVFRAALPVSLQNMRAPQLEQLWLQESKATCTKAVKSVVNCGLPPNWCTVPNCARILGQMGLHPDFLKQKPRLRLTEKFSKEKTLFFALAGTTRKHRDTCLRLLAAETKVNLADLNDDEFEKKDKRAYDLLRRLAACGDALADGANAETQMPTKDEIPEISQRTVKPPFEPVPIGAGLANPAFARQFRRLDQSFYSNTARSRCTRPSRAPLNHPELSESSVRHYVATICKHRPVLRHLLLPLFAQGRPRLRRALQEEEASAVHQRRLSCL